VNAMMRYARGSAAGRPRMARTWAWITKPAMRKTTFGEDPKESKSESADKQPESDEGIFRATFLKSTDQVAKGHAIP